MNICDIDNFLQDEIDKVAVRSQRPKFSASLRLQTSPPCRNELILDSTREQLRDGFIELAPRYSIAEQEDDCRLTGRVKLDDSPLRRRISPQLEKIDMSERKPGPSEPTAKPATRHKKEKHLSTRSTEGLPRQKQHVKNPLRSHSFAPITKDPPPSRFNARRSTRKNKKEPRQVTPRSDGRTWTGESQHLRDEYTKSSFKGDIYRRKFELLKEEGSELLKIYRHQKLSLKRMEELKRDYETLFREFEKSEKIRREQQHYIDLMEIDLQHIVNESSKRLPK